MDVLRRLRWLGRTAGAIGLVAATSVVAFPWGSASAAGLCGVTGSVGGAGATSPYLSSTYGVRADIETNRPLLCSAEGGSPSSSSAWAMLVPQGDQYYAQAGYVRNGPETSHPAGFHYLAQYRKPSGAAPTFIAGDPGTATHTYAVYLRASDDRIHMTRDGVNLLTMDYDTTGVWNPAWSGQFFGEAWHAKTDIPGTNSDRTRFNYIQRYLANGGIDFIETLTPRTTLSRYHRDVGNASVGGRYLDIWTNPL